MKKLLSILLALLTIFSVMSFIGCKDNEPTDEDIALGYLAEVKGYTYEEGVKQSNGWSFGFYYYSFGDNEGGTLTISADGTCTFDINSYLQGTFKIGNFIKYVKEEGYYFEMLENATPFKEFCLSLNKLVYISKI